VEAICNVYSLEGTVFAIVECGPEYGIGYGVFEKLVWAVLALLGVMALICNCCIDMSEPPKKTIP